MLHAGPITAAALALSISAYGCQRRETPTTLGRPIPAISPPPGLQATTATTSPASDARSRRLQAIGNTSWLVDPDRPVPAASRWWSVLAVARRFATANAAYQTARLSTGVRKAITDTCTPPFARLLLGNVPALPPGLGASGLWERLEAVQPLAKLPHAALVLVHVTRNVRGDESAGTLELTLVDARDRWRVSSLTVLS